MLSFLLLLAVSVTPNWLGDYRPCSHSGELRKTGHMDLPVRFEVGRKISSCFRKALDFWSNVLDMDWSETDDEDCSISILVGTDAILGPGAVVARSQFVDIPRFQGWIAFDPHARDYMTRGEIYTYAVHELGHTFGLKHNDNPRSLMYYIDTDDSCSLDGHDLAELAKHHALRIPLSRKK